ncbi:hypothetical protein [Endozoicomonas numazuensis]|uniref:Lipoprotein n=1 Tax=Endozoicomonas numazuensis TaxID=1137799 RepID=A0A081N6N2_9GAMM|nr:hypothetical protein [Endozoicomonas numazuensis]KEQ14105.1 hypothetical protein GZ78_26165 [Endozoicomonas numazuensis]
MTIIARFLSLLLVAVLSGCASDYKTSSPLIETRTYAGVDAVPDPVLEQTLELEKQGILSNVAVMESFPVQITATGPVRVLECISNPGGTWVPAHNECEGMNQTTCEQLGGDFNECASACRHQTDAMICFQVCVPICTFTSQ